MAKIVIIGGANLDLFARSDTALKLHDSNPGTLKIAYGGVGRNIAENLGRLNIQPKLITALHDDAQSTALVKHAEDAGITMSVIPTAENPTYLSIINADGELFTAIAAMKGLDVLNQTSLSPFKPIIDEAELLVVDANLSEDTLNYIFKDTKTPKYVDAISTKKALKLKPYLNDIHTLKMNRYEAEALCDMPCETADDFKSIGTYFMNHGVKEILLTLGETGVYYHNNSHHYLTKTAPVKPLNTTGAGDAFFAGYIYGVITKDNPIEYGLANARLTLMCDSAVNQKLTPNLLKASLKEMKA